MEQGSQYSHDRPETKFLKSEIFLTSQVIIMLSSLLFSSFFNNIIGISDPSQLNPPDFCADAETTGSTEEAADFLSLFLKKD